MQRFQDLPRQHRALTAWLLAIALLLKVFVPTGYMLDTSGGRVGLIWCSGLAPTMPAAMPGMSHRRAHEGKKGDEKTEQPCAFAGLTAVSLAAADPLLLALAVAFIVAAVFRRGSQKPFGARVRLRPPLRAPPARL